MKIEYESPAYGPRGEKLIHRDKKVMFGAHTRTREIPLVVENAEGVMIRDVDGRDFLDFGAGYAVCATGHCHPEVIKVVESQIRRLMHISGSDFYYEPQVELAERLVQITPGHFDKKVYFCSTGVECLEASVKICRHYTGRHGLVSFLGAFHGRTYAGMSLSGSKKVQRAHFSPLIPGVIHTFYPYCYRCPLNLTYPQCRLGPRFDSIPMLPCVAYLTDVIFEQLVDPDEVAALIVETILGEGGYVVPPPEFHPLLRAITKMHGIIYVVDEIQAGLGRTGKMFAVEHWKAEPDVICIAKAIASGIPLGAVVARAELMDEDVNPKAWRRGSHGSTFGGNPVACAAGLKTLDLIQGGLVDNAREVGGWIIQELNRFMDSHRIVGDVRGKGLMIGVEIVKDKETKERLPNELTKEGKNIKEVVMGNCFKKGLIVLGCGKNSIRFSPPLVLTLEDAGRGLSLFESVLEDVEKQLQM